MSRRPCHHLGVCNAHPSPGCTCRRDNCHDTEPTEPIPCGGFFFAPGTVEEFAPRPSLSRRLKGYLLAASIVLGVLVLDAAAVLALAALGHYGGAW